MDLESNEVVADRRGDTPDWVWSPPETAYHDTYVEILLHTPNGMRRAVGIYRKGPFWGKVAEGWFAPERILENGRPSHNMYIDGFVKGWRPYRYHRTPAVSTDIVERLVERVSDDECSVCGKSRKQHYTGSGVGVCQIYPVFRSKREVVRAALAAIDVPE